MRTISLALLAIVIALGGSSLWLQGPLPLDLEMTRGLQRLIDARSPWIEWLSMTAGWPGIIATTLVAAVFAASLARLPGAVALILGTGVAMASERLLRMLIYAPRPSDATVEVAKISASSGLPSTFALFYGALCGSLILLGGGKNGREGTAVRWAAGALLLVGCAGRVAAGGHWTSQVLASAALGGLAAILALRLAGVRR